MYAFSWVGLKLANGTNALTLFRNRAKIKKSELNFVAIVEYFLEECLTACCCSGMLLLWVLTYIVSRSTKKHRKIHLLACGERERRETPRTFNFFSHRLFLLFFFLLLFQFPKYKSLRQSEK
jgi:hypothetical protein